MKSITAKPQQKGFVLIVVLCMVIMLTGLLVGFNHKSRTSLHQADSLRKSMQALNCAWAGLNIVAAAISSGEDIFTNKALWELFSQPKRFALDEATCRVTVTEESGKLNINMLRDKNGRLVQARLERLLRLIELLNRDGAGDFHIGPDAAAAIIDWTDKDENVTRLTTVRGQISGAESDYYSRLENPYRCKNAPFGVVDELHLVKGITPQLCRGIRDYVTVWGEEEKVNINYAAQVVIESLSEEMDQALAGMIIESRKIRPFESIAQLRDVPGMTDGVYNRISSSITVRPKAPCYRVVAEGCVDDINCAITAVLKKNTETKNVDILLYKEFQDNALGID